MALYTLGRGLNVLQDLTRDPQPLIRALEQYRGELSAAPGGAPLDTAGTGLERFGSWLDELETNLIEHYAKDRALRTLRSLVAIANHLERVPGRKNLVWVSGSFPVWIGRDRVPLPRAPRSRRAGSLARDRPGGAGPEPRQPGGLPGGRARADGARSTTSRSGPPSAGRCSSPTAPASRPWTPSRNERAGRRSTTTTTSGEPSAGRRGFPRGLPARLPAVARRVEREVPRDQDRGHAPRGAAAPPPRLLRPARRARRRLVPEAACWEPRCGARWTPPGSA